MTPIIKSRKEAVERIDLLIDYLKFHSKLYYKYPMNGGFTMISDAEWDLKYRELQALENYHIDIPIRRDSPTQNVDYAQCFNDELNNSHCTDKHYPNQLDKKNSLIKFNLFCKRFDKGTRNIKGLTKQELFYIKHNIYAMYWAEIASPTYTYCYNGAILIKFQNKFKKLVILNVLLLEVKPIEGAGKRLFYLQRIHRQHSIADKLLFVRY